MSPVGAHRTGRNEVSRSGRAPARVRRTCASHLGLGVTSAIGRGPAAPAPPRARGVWSLVLDGGIPWCASKWRGEAAPRSMPGRERTGRSSKKRTALSRAESPLSSFRSATPPRREGLAGEVPRAGGCRPQTPAQTALGASRHRSVVPSWSRSGAGQDTDRGLGVGRDECNWAGACCPRTPAQRAVGRQGATYRWERGCAIGASAVRRCAGGPHVINVILEKTARHALSGLCSVRTDTQLAARGARGGAGAREVCVRSRRCCCGVGFWV